MIQAALPTIYALLAAMIGAGLFQLAGVPAGPLVGATLAVTALAAWGMQLKIPNVLRNLGFTTIGVTLGAGITPHFFSDMFRYPASLAALTVTVVIIMIVSGTTLNRFFGATPTTATLATSPGALSFTLSLAAERPEDADIRFVMVLQCLRLFVLTVFLPPAIAVIDKASGGSGVFVVGHALDMPQSLVLIAVATVGGFLFEKMKIPAAYILAGMVLSGLGHGAGWLDGRPATALTFIGFALAGAVIGVRFSGISAAQIRSLTKAGLVISFLALSISGLVSVVVAHFLALPLGQVWVSFAPGGVEGMSAMALSLGYDPAYVATHHIFRLVLILTFLPVVLRWTGKKSPLR